MPDRRPAPRRLAFHLLTVVAFVICLVAARWQWDRAHRTEADAVPDAAVVDLADLDPTATYSGMRVRILGTFDAAHEALVAPRSRDGQPGSWVFTPLVPDGSGAGRVAVGVVRGWIPAGQRPASPPAGEVAVVGVLVADERRIGRGAEAGDPPTIAVVDTGALADLAGHPVRSGWFALQQMQPTGEGQPLPLRVTELPGADVGLNWQNAAYAVQWIVFAGFTLFFWNRYRREHSARDVEQETTP